MAVSSDPPSTSTAATTSMSPDHSTLPAEKPLPSSSSMLSISPTNTNGQPKPSLSTSEAFTGEDLDPNNTIPSLSDIQALDDYQVFDREGKAKKFRSLYTGSNVARRILLIFVRHFFCGNCQEYLRTLSLTLPPPTLLSLTTQTFIAIIGCGQASLIDMYANATQCPYPIYADPSKGLYRALNMGRTLDLGKRPEYQRRSLVVGMLQSVGQSLKMVRGGMVFKGGDYQQVGGEFLFEPVDWDVTSPIGEENRQLGIKDNEIREHCGERKQITWCHRMRNTRDHVEIPELLEVLGVEIENEEIVRGKDRKKWERALAERKGTGLPGDRGSRGYGMPIADFGESERRSQRSRASSEKLMGTPDIDETPELQGDLKAALRE